MNDGDGIRLRIEASAIADDRGVVAPAAGAETVSLVLDVSGPGEAAFEPQGWGERRAVSGDEVRVIGVETGAVRELGADHAIDRRGCVLVPGFVNAHTHLDLTSVGPRVFDEADGFAAWAQMVRGARPADDAAIAASVRAGAALSLLGGVVAVGDIAGSPPAGPTVAAVRALAGSRLVGTGFVEFFGIMAAAERGWGVIEGVVRAAAFALGDEMAAGGVRLGLQPHAPNTASAANYRRAVELCRELGIPLSTHLAETAAERAFIGAAAGPQRGLLESLGLWIDDPADPERVAIGRGVHPIRHVREALGSLDGWLLAHVNDAGDDGEGDDLIGALAGAAVAYCPRSAAYFGNDRPGARGGVGPHRYPDMLAAGVNVCLGTDSVINLEAAADEAGGGGGRWPAMTTWDDACVLVARDGLDPVVALGMATTRGAAALGLPSDRFRLAAGCGPFGVAAVPMDEDGEGAVGPLFRAVRGRAAGSVGGGVGGAVELLCLRNACCLTGEGDKNVA